ncbi:MAG: lamin tail domain-containing protein [Candidatus Auribacterota bacterium]
MKNWSRMHFVLFCVCFIVCIVSASAGYTVQKLVINEVYYAFDGGTVGQWVELYNSGDEAIDLSSANLRLQISSSTSWVTGGAQEFSLTMNYTIAPGTYFLISNTANALGTNLYADYVNTSLLVSKPVGIFSVRGVRILLNGVVSDAILYGKPDGSSTNMAALDPTGYYSGGGAVSAVPIVSGTPNNFSLTRDNFLDMNHPDDWDISATPTPQSAPPFTISTLTPAVNELVLMTRGYMAKSGFNWDFDGNGIVDAIDESAVLIRYPSNSVVRPAVRASGTLGSASQAVTVGNAGTAADSLYDNNDDYRHPSGAGMNTTGGYTHVGDGYWTDMNTGKGSTYYEYPVTVSKTGYYDIALSAPFEGDFANNVPVEIVSTGYDTFSAIWDQTLNSDIERPMLFTTVATVFLQKNQTHYVRVKNNNTLYTVVADACAVVRAGTWAKDNEGVYLFEDLTDTADTDNDSIPDGWEITYNLNPLANDASGDGDVDNLTNYEEYLYHTDPTNADTDGDGRNDGLEVDQETDPTVPDDPPIVIDVTECTFTAEGVKITWTHDTQYLHRIYWTDSLSGTPVWHNVNYSTFYSHIINNGNGTRSWIDRGLDDEMLGVSPYNAGKRFYRVTAFEP